MSDQLFNCFGNPIDIMTEAKYGKGYAGAPGSGPDDETCGTCDHLVVRTFSKRYFKCGLGPMTYGAATDVRKKSPACHKWKAKE